MEWVLVIVIWMGGGNGATNIQMESKEVCIFARDNLNIRPTNERPMNTQHSFCMNTKTGEVLKNG